MRTGVREYVLTVLLLLATLAAAFFPVLFEGRTMLPTDLIDSMTLPFSNYFGPQGAYNTFVVDGALQLYPLKLLTKQAYEHGIFNFWNPFILNGYPSYLNGELIYSVLLFLPMSVGFPALVLMPLFVAGIGMYALLRSYSIRMSVARIFAIAYMLNALFISNLLAHFLPAAFSFAPFLLFFLRRYDRNPKFQYLAGASISFALGILAGNLQMATFLCVTTFIFWFAIWWNRKNRTISTFFKPVAVVLLFALALSSITLFPMIELFLQTSHGGAFFSTSFLRSYSILQRIESIGISLTFFVPQLAGSVRGVLLQQAVGVYPQDFEAAIGFVPLFFALWGGWMLWKSKRDIRPFAILMLVGFFLPVATPLFRFIYHRFLAIFILGACGAGAIGMEEFLSISNWNESIRTWAKRFAMCLLVIIAAITAFSIYRMLDPVGIEHFFQTHLLPRLKSSVFAEGNPQWVQNRFQETLNYWSTWRWELLSGIGSTFVLLCLIFWKDRFHTRTFLVSIGTITVLQLILFVRMWVPMLDTSQYPAYPETRETKLLQTFSKDSRLYCYREIDTARQFVFMDNENVVYGIPSATGYESMTPRSLYIYSSILHWKDSGLISPQFLGKFNIGTLVRAKPLLFPSLRLVDSNSIWIYKNPYSTPRVFLAFDGEILPNDTAILDRMADSTSQWPAAYFTPDQDIHSNHTSKNLGDTVVITKSGTNEVDLNSHSSDNSYLVLTDTYYPGWKAHIDGKEAPIYRCNYAMRAVALPSGSHSIVFSFEPDSYRVSSWISSISLLILIGMTVVGWKQK